MSEVCVLFLMFHNLCLFEQLTLWYVYLLGPIAKRRVVVSAAACPLDAIPKRRVVVSASSLPLHSTNDHFLSLISNQLCEHNTYHKKKYIQECKLHHQLCCTKALPSIINHPEGHVPEFPELMMESLDLDDPLPTADLDMDLSFLDF